MNYDETILRKHLSKWRNKAGVALGVIGTAILGRRIHVILGFIAAGIWLWQSADPVFWHTIVGCVVMWILADALTWGFAVGLQFIGNITMDCMMADVLRDDHVKRSWNAINYGKAFEENKRAEFVEAIKQLCEK
jgi:hypothetical protein